MSNYVNLMDVVYPVGSVYCTASSASPASSIGGTWTKVANDKFVCTGTPLSYGGTNSIYLNADQIPDSFWSSQTQSNGKDKTYKKNFAPGGSLGINCSPSAKTGGKAVDNRPAYIAFNIYYRTA